MRLDARAAKLLPPGEHMIVDGCPGLRLVATRSTRTWTYRYRSPVDGRMRQVAIGKWPAMPLPTAIGKWDELRAQRDDGLDPVLERKQARVDAAPRRPAYTVRSVADDYLAGHIDRRRKPKGAAEVRRMFDRLLGPLAVLPAADLTRRQAFDLLEGLADTPVQAKMLRQELAAAWDYAADAGRLPDSAPNWWRLVMRGRLRSKGAVLQGKNRGTAKRVLSESELGELILWLPNFTRLVRDALTLYLWTGTRGAEIVQMHASEITHEDDGWWWTIPKAKTKNARHVDAADLRVPLVGRSLEVVRRRMEQADGWIFSRGTRRGEGHIKQKVLSVAVWNSQPYCKSRPEYQRPRLTVTHWAPHDLRRSVRTLLAAMHCPADVAESVLGHMQPGIEGVYNLHRYDAERREWLGKLDQRLEQLADQALAGGAS